MLMLVLLVLLVLKLLLMLLLLLCEQHVWHRSCKLTLLLEADVLLLLLNVLLINLEASKLLLHVVYSELKLLLHHLFLA
jgi:hypothetical protein